MRSVFDSIINHHHYLFIGFPPPTHPGILQPVVSAGPELVMLDVVYYVMDPVRFRCT